MAARGAHHPPLAVRATGFGRCPCTVALRASCQREIAENLLRRGTVPVEDIAHRLGFSDDRAFRRAFREWTGETPTEFRRQRRDAPPP